MAKQNEKKEMSLTSKWLIVIAVLVGLFIISGFFAAIINLSQSGDYYEGKGNVLIIPIKGIILPESEASLFSDEAAGSRKIIEKIERAEKNPSIKAVVFEINSPGGSPVASHEIVKAVKAMKKPSVALIRETGASGAYWVASATDYIVADELSITGSVGVLSSYVDFSGFLERYNITYERLVGGEYKDIGTSMKPLTEDERVLLMEKITLIHKFFLEDVVSNRNLSRQQELTINSGIFFLGIESMEQGLIDKLGGIEEVKEHIQATINEKPEFIRAEERKGFLDLFGSLSKDHGYYVGKGLGAELKSSGLEKDSSIFLR